MTSKPYEDQAARRGAVAAAKAAAEQQATKDAARTQKARDWSIGRRR